MRAATVGLLAIASLCACGTARREVQPRPPPVAAACPVDSEAMLWDAGTAELQVDLEPPRPRFEGATADPEAPEGLVRWEALGCLSGPPTLAEGSLHPPPHEALARELLPVRVEALEGGARILHELVHPCCLQARVEVGLERGEVRVREVLVGQPCACRCASTLVTELRLGPGRHLVRLLVEGPGDEEAEVHRAELSVPGSKRAAD